MYSKMNLHRTFQTFYSHVLELLTSQIHIERIKWGKRLEERKSERFWDDWVDRWWDSELDLYPWNWWSDILEYFGN